MINNIEDCLEHLVGLRSSPVRFAIDKTDISIMQSIAKQVFRGIPLTDRQFILVKEKLLAYKQQFNDAGLDNFINAIDQTRMPLRHIDRSKYIKLEDDKIIIRFPFRKSDIMLIHEFSSTSEGYYHQKGSHKHSFDYNEYNVLNLLDRFNNKEFKINQEILDLYSTIKEIQKEPQRYLSGILDNKLINIKPALAAIINNEIGELSKKTLTKFIDRRLRYGFNYVDLFEPKSLADTIAVRKEFIYQSKPSKESISDILSALWQLNRFPLLVVLDKNNAEEQLYEFANYYRDILDPVEQSVLFRLEDSDAGFNQLVKDRKLNNWVDKNTKVVYISKDKLPKILINNEWNPTATFSYNSYVDRCVDNYMSFNCDLIVYREETASPFKRYYGRM